MVYTTNNRLQQILSTRKNASISIAGVTLFMVVLMLVLAILPAYRSITDQLKNNEAKLVYLTELRAKRDIMDSLNEDYSLNQKKIELFERYNSDVSNSEVLLANISEMAKNHNCILSNVNIDDPKASERPAYVEFGTLMEKNMSLGFRGTLADLSLLFVDLENFPIPINIWNVNYSHYVESTSGVGTGVENDDVLILSDPVFQLTMDTTYFVWTKQI